VNEIKAMLIKLIKSIRDHGQEKPKA